MKSPRPLTTLSRRVRLLLWFSVPLPALLLLFTTTLQYETELRSESERRLALRAKDSGLEVYGRLVDLTADLRVAVLGHYLAIFLITFSQFIVLLVFGQLILNVNYLRDTGATLLTAVSAALCIAALGVLIGTLAGSEEQAIIFALIPMFVFAGLGGAWVPLEVTGPTFQAIGHLSPIAWAMDGFMNVSVRGLGIESVLFPSAALVGYALLFFFLAAWRLQVSQEH